MGNTSSNYLSIPPGKGPNAVGCTDFMVDHTTQVDVWLHNWSRRRSWPWCITPLIIQLFHVVCVDGRATLTFVPQDIKQVEMLLEFLCLCSQGSFFRLYYPCQESDNGVKPDWIPCREYFNGLADFMKFNRTFTERVFNYLYGKLTSVCNIQSNIFSTLNVFSGAGWCFGINCT